MPAPDSANDPRQTEAKLLEVRAQQEAYYRAAAEHKKAIYALRAGQIDANLNGSQLLHSLGVAEHQAFERYSEAVRALADAELRCVEAGGSPVAPELTRRERQVVKLIAEGFSSKEVAAQLGISVKTTIVHRYRLMEKLDIHNVASLVKYAIRCGIVQP